MPTQKHPMLQPFAHLPEAEQIKLSNLLFTNLENLIMSGRSDEIPELRVQMKQQHNMDGKVFQYYLEEIYNTQIQTLLDENGNARETLKCFLTAIPVTFFPEYELDEPIKIEGYIGREYDGWVQEVIATMVSNGYLRSNDVHYAVPMLLDIRDLFETPEKAFQLISQTISGDLSLEYPPKKIILNKEHLTETRYIVFVTGCKDLQAKTAIVPEIHDCFTEYSDMQGTIESIIKHYWDERATRDGVDMAASIIVGAPTEAASAVRIKQPSEGMANLAYNILKYTDEIDPKKLTVVVERNQKARSLAVNIYVANTCLMSFSYPKLHLAEGFELAMIGYILDTSNLAHYRVVDTDEKADASRAINRPLIRVVK